ncbi:MAG: hypothetical protein LBL13_11050 [Bacteroidales bacterium]|jgi:hypothetical protein|nr:hypothetical protein [Bacteroidales bacterium]
MNKKANYIFEFIFYATISATLVFLIAQVIGFTDASFPISVLAILLSIIAYIISFFSSKTIEDSIVSIKSSATIIENSSVEILELQKNLNNEFVGQTNGFVELFEKTIEILEDSVENGKTVKLILPFPSFGFINKKTRGKYNIFKKHIKSLLESEKEFELYILNPFNLTWSNGKNELSLFFNRIITYAKDGDIYEREFSQMIKEYFLFLSEICLYYDNSQYKCKKNVYLLNEIFQNCILTESSGKHRSLLFFLHPPFNELNLENNVIESNGYHSLTPEFRILVEKLITIQKEKFDVISLFTNYDSLDLYFTLKEISEEIKTTDSDDQCCEKIDSIIKNYISANNYRKSERIENKSVDIRIFEFGEKKENDSCLLVFPSAAGIFSHNPNYRFNIYRKLCTSLSKNRRVLLCSFSGQDNFSEFEGKKFKFSLSQSKEDIKHIYNRLAGENILGAFAICIGAQSFLAYSKENGQKHSVFIWDMPDRPGWHLPVKYFESHRINVDIQQCMSTEDPIYTLQDFNEGNLFYAFSNKSKNAQRKFEEIIKLLSSKTNQHFHFKHKTYNELKHVPCHEDNESEYIQLLDDIDTFLTTSAQAKRSPG